MDAPHKDNEKQTPKGVNAPLSRRVLACQRCRDRKQKCDNLRPRCSHCIHANKDCTPQKGTRSWQQPNIDMDALIRRLAFLEEKLQVGREATVDSEHDTVAMALDTEPPGVTAGDSPMSRAPKHSMDPPVHPANVPPISSVLSQWEFPQPVTSAREEVSTSPASRVTAAELSSSILAVVASPTSEMQNHSPLPARSLSQGPPDLDDAGTSPSDGRIPGTKAVDPLDSLTAADAKSLYEAYLSYVQPQYPFLCRRELDRLCGHWNAKSASCVARELDAFEKCVVYSVFSVGALIYDGNTRQQPSRSGLLHSHIQKHYLPVILSGRCLIKQTTVLLLLTMRALHNSSSNTIIQHTSAAVRTAITAGLHRRAPIPFQAVASGEQHSHAEHMKRRIWWCCYGLDRAVAMVFGHPVSISDDFVTTEMFANVPKAGYGRGASLDAADHQRGVAEDVSVAYHLTFGRKIQSRIINTFSNPLLEQATQTALDKIRSQFCQELEEWQGSIPVVEDKPGYGGRGWFRMVAYYSMLGLVSGLNDDIRQAVGAKVVVACCNACITFQKVSRSRQIAQSWLAVLSQFQAGVTILYCFWTTPLAMRTEEFEPSYASRGVRTCSNNLVLLAERWAEAEPYRDTFEILSKAVSLNDDHLTTTHRRLTPADLADLEKLVTEVKYLGSHFRTIEMVEEILYERRPAWPERGRRSFHSSYELPLAPQHYPQAHPPAPYSGRYGESPGLGSWDNGQGEGTSMVDPYQRAPAYLGLGDPWTDPLNHIYP